jgi:hypothetical protein
MGHTCGEHQRFLVRGPVHVPERRRRVPERTMLRALVVDEGCAQPGGRLGQRVDSRGAARLSLHADRSLSCHPLSVACACVWRNAGEPTPSRAGLSAALPAVGASRRQPRGLAPLLWRRLRPVLQRPRLRPSRDSSVCTYARTRNDRSRCVPVERRQEHSSRKVYRTVRTGTCQQCWRLKPAWKNCRAERSSYPRRPPEYDLRRCRRIEPD